MARSDPSDPTAAFTFGGPAFNDRPERVGEVLGTFLSESIQSAIDTIEWLMNDRKSNQ